MDTFKTKLLIRFYLSVLNNLFLLKSNCNHLTIQMLQAVNTYAACKGGSGVFGAGSLAAELANAKTWAERAFFMVPSASGHLPQKQSQCLRIRIARQGASNAMTPHATSMTTHVHFDLPPTVEEGLRLTHNAQGTAEDGRTSQARVGGVSAAELLLVLDYRELQQSPLKWCKGRL